MDEDTDPQASSGRMRTAEAEPSLSLDAIFEVLADRRRRFVLYELVDSSDGTMELDKLVEEVVTLEAALSDKAVTYESYRETARELYHWHLPVLSDVGLVDSDSRHRTIRYLNNPDLETWVRRVKREELREEN